MELKCLLNDTPCDDITLFIRSFIKDHFIYQVINKNENEKLIKKMAPSIPMLGVCLGHQCIGSTFGAKVGYAGEVKHGKVSVITHDEKGIFKNIKNTIKVVRYHSL